MDADRSGQLSYLELVRFTGSLSDTLWAGIDIDSQGNVTPAAWQRFLRLTKASRGSAALHDVLSTIQRGADQVQQERRTYVEATLRVYAPEGALEAEPSKAAFSKAVGDAVCASLGVAGPPCVVVWAVEAAPDVHPAEYIPGWSPVQATVRLQGVPGAQGPSLAGLEHLVREACAEPTSLLHLGAVSLVPGEGQLRLQDSPTGPPVALSQHSLAVALGVFALFDREDAGSFPVAALHAATGGDPGGDLAKLSVAEGFVSKEAWGSFAELLKGDVGPEGAEAYMVHLLVNAEWLNGNGNPSVPPPEATPSAEMSRKQIRRAEDVFNAMDSDRSPSQRLTPCPSLSLVLRLVPMAKAAVDAYG